MRLRVGRWVLVAVVAGSVWRADAAELISHIGDTDPVTEGWTAAPLTAGQSRLPNNDDPGAGNCDSPCPFWRITDNGSQSGNLGGYSYTPVPYNAPGGWEFRARVRPHALQPGTAEGLNLTRIMLVRFPVGPNLTQEYIVQFAIGEGDTFIVAGRGSGGPATELGSAWNYHLVQIVYNPQEANTDVLVDGELVFRDFTGLQLERSENKIEWGSGSSGNRGSSNWHELRFLTDPDSDGDGLGNEEERSTHGTDPLAADSDDDGLDDGGELAAGTGPLDPDSDDDGLPDGYEVLYGLDALSAADGSLDQDLDGLDNAQELELGTDPLTADSDGDGLRDGEEIVVYETLPMVADTDGDGLTDGDEVALYGTDPRLPDSDGDSLADGDELSQHQTDPTDGDSDADGLGDGDELLRGSDPLLADTDGDGLLDGFEARSGFDPLVAGEQDLDGDGDGLDSLAEQTAGTDPQTADTDGDGLDDGEEAGLGTNPTSPDGDGDGLTDSFEVAYDFDALTPGEALLDPDNDGLVSLREQEYGSDPRDADSDDDGFRDGEEVHVLGTSPTVPNPAGLPLSRATPLRFEAVDQPLFTDLPAPEFVDLVSAYAELPDEAKRKTRGEVRTIDQRVPLIAAQEAWDRALDQCDAYEEAIDVPPACRDRTVSPTRQQCLNGGNINIEGYSITCCASGYTGLIDRNDSISNDCVDRPFPLPDNYEASFTIKNVNDLPGGPYAPTTMNIGSGFPPRPTQAPPPQPFTVGALITQETSVTGGFTVDPGFGGTDPGAVDVYYATRASASVDRSVVAPGEHFTIDLRHAPEPYRGSPFTGTASSCSARMAGELDAGSCLSSRWPTTDLRLSLDFTVGIDASAEIWSMDPSDGGQLHETLSIFDTSESFSAELAALEFTAADELNLRMLQGVPNVPDWLTQDLLISSDDLLIGSLLEPGTALPVPIDVPFGCILKKINPALCLSFNMPESSPATTNLANFRFQIPELNTPVSAPDNGNPPSTGFLGGAPAPFSLAVVEPERHRLDPLSGELSNTVPNRFRPTLNFTKATGFTDEGILNSLIRDNSNLSSDRARYEIDLDGLICAGTGGTACSGASAGIPLVVSLSVDIVDLDAVAWIGWDQVLTFEPNLKATLRFSRAVSARLPGAADFSAIAADTPVDIFVPTPQAGGAPGQVEVVQPEGGVDVDITWSFSDNRFRNQTVLQSKLALELGVLQFEVGGLVGAAIQGALGFPFRFGALNFIAESNTPVENQSPAGADYALQGVTTEFPGPLLRIADLSQDQDGDGLSDDQEQAGCTSVGDADSDDDGLVDGMEDADRDGVRDPSETDPCAADSDGDSRQDGAELGLLTPNADTDPAIFEPSTAPEQRTDPLDGDSDDDGLGDGDELFVHGTMPLNGDTDGDGLSDGAEVLVRGTNPLNRDTDGDGIPDTIDNDNDNDGVPDSEDPAPFDRMIPIPMEALPSRGGWRVILQ